MDVSNWKFLWMAMSGYRVQTHFVWYLLLSALSCPSSPFLSTNRSNWRSNDDFTFSFRAPTDCSINWIVYLVCWSPLAKHSCVLLQLLLLFLLLLSSSVWKFIFACAHDGDHCVQLFRQAIQCTLVNKWITVCGVQAIILTKMQIEMKENKTKVMLWCWSERWALHSHVCQLDSRCKEVPIVANKVLCVCVRNRGRLRRY